MKTHIKSTNFNSRASIIMEYIFFNSHIHIYTFTSPPTTKIKLSIFTIKSFGLNKIEKNPQNYTSIHINMKIWEASTTSKLIHKFFYKLWTISLHTTIYPSSNIDFPRNGEKKKNFIFSPKLLGNINDAVETLQDIKIVGACKLQMRIWLFNLQ